MSFGGIQKTSYNLTDRQVKKLERQILADYKTAMKAVKAKLRALYNKFQDNGVPPAEYYNFATKRNRLASLNRILNEQYKDLAKSTNQKVVASSRLSFANMFYRSQYTTNWALTDEVFVVLNQKVIEASVFGTPQAWGNLEAIYGSQVNYIPKSGTLINEILKKKNAETLQKIEQTIRQGLLQGNSFTKTTSALRGVFDTDYNKAMRIVRTESIRNMGMGELATVESYRSKGVEIKRQWLTTLDDRTRASHITADGQSEDKNGNFHVGGAIGNAPGNLSSASESINCRCTTINVVGDFTPTVRRGRDPLTGESDIMTYKSADEWLKSHGVKMNRYGEMYVKS